MLKLVKSVGKFVLRELQEIVEAILRDWPGELGVIVRRGYYRCRLKYVGKGVIIKTGVRFSGHRYITLLDGCIIDMGCLIAAGSCSQTQYETLYKPNKEFELSDGEVRIGRKVHISVGCYILGNGGFDIGDFSGLAAGTRVLSVTNHYASFADPSRHNVYFTINVPLENACFMYGPIVLKENVGVAANCVLLPGLTIHKDSFLSIGSVAKGVVVANSIAGGNPVVRIKERFKSHNG